MKTLNDLLWTDDLKIYQDDKRFKFSMDSVLLSNFVTINQKDKKILDIGTGNAPIPLLLTKRCNAHIVGVEIQKESYDLAKESVLYNKIDNIELINDDINNYAKSLESDTFDIIISNPPYFKTNNYASNNNSKKIARNETNLNLDNLFKISRKLLKNNGNIALVHRTERLVDILLMMKNNNIEPKKIQYIYPKKDKESNLVLIEGTKNGKVGLKMLPPLIVHNDDSFTKEIVNILTNFGEEV